MVLQWFRASRSLHFRENNTLGDLLPCRGNLRTTFRWPLYPYIYIYILVLSFFSHVICLVYLYIHTVSSAWPVSSSVYIEPCVSAGTNFAKCSQTAHRISVQFCMSVGPYNSRRLLVDAADEGSDIHVVRRDQKTPWLLNSMNAWITWSYNAYTQVCSFFFMKRPEHYVGLCHAECCIYFYAYCCPRDRSMFANSIANSFGILCSMVRLTRPMQFLVSKSHACGGRQTSQSH